MPPPEPTTVLFGAGHFQRAFTGWLLHRLGPSHRAVVVRVTDGGPYDDLEAAGWRYPVWTRGLSGGEAVDEVEWVGSVAEAVYPYVDFAAYLRLAERPGLRALVSNTTEAGIAFADEPLPAGRPARTFPGKLAQWLHHRWRHFDGDPDRGVVALPLELIEDNGAALRDCLERYAGAWGYPPAFTTWLRAHCEFCDTLVDRIVPGRPDADLLAARDLPPVAVVAEPYHLWAIRGAPDRLRARWPTEAAGLNVRWVDDLAAARALKVRLLNGAHTALVPVGLRHGVATVREFVDHDRWGPWLRGLLAEDLGRALEAHPRAEVEAYVETVLERFGNPYVEHRLESILLNSLSKWPARLGPTVAHYLARGEAPPERLRFAWSCQLDLARERGAAGMPDDAGAVERLVASSPSLAEFATA